MAIEDIKRLPTTYEQTSVSRDVANNVAGKDAGQKHTESVQDTGKTQPVSDVVSAASQSAESPENGNVSEAIGKLQEYVQNLDRELQFAVDDDTGRTVVTILDAATQKVLRQIPSEELLELSKSLEQTQGVLFKNQA